MKSVLIIDTPSRCDECQLCYDKWFCWVTENKIEKIDDEDDLEYTCPVPSWCPLKPLPKYGALGSVVTAEGYTLSTASELLNDIVGDDE